MYSLFSISCFFNISILHQTCSTLFFCTLYAVSMMILFTEVQCKDCNNQFDVFVLMVYRYKNNLVIDRVTNMKWTDTQVFRNRIILLCLINSNVFCADPICVQRYLTLCLIYIICQNVFKYGFSYLRIVGNDF